MNAPTAAGVPDAATHALVLRMHGARVSWAQIALVAGISELLARGIVALTADTAAAAAPVPPAAPTAAADASADTGMPALESTRGVKVEPAAAAAAPASAVAVPLPQPPPAEAKLVKSDGEVDEPPIVFPARPPLSYHPLACRRGELEFEPAIRFDAQQNGQPPRMELVRLDEAGSSELTDAHFVVWLGRSRDVHLGNERADIEADMLHHYRELQTLSLHHASELRHKFPQSIHSMGRVAGLSKNCIAIRLTHPLTRFKFDNQLMMYTLFNFEVFSLRELVNFIPPFNQSPRVLVTDDPAKYTPCIFEFSTYGKCTLSRCVFSHDRHQLAALRRLRHVYLHMASQPAAVPSSTAPVVGTSQGATVALTAEEGVKYQTLLDDCVVEPLPLAVLAEWAPATRSSVPTFVLPPFAQLHERLPLEKFNFYLTLCRRRRIQWRDCPLTLTPTSPRWRVADAQEIWQRLLALVDQPSAALEQAQRQLVFLARNTDSRRVVLHFKTPEAALIVARDVCNANPHLLGYFHTLGRTAPNDTLMEPLPLPLPLQFVAVSARAGDSRPPVPLTTFAPSPAALMRSAERRDDADRERAHRAARSRSRSRSPRPLSHRVRSPPPRARSHRSSQDERGKHSWGGEDRRRKRSPSPTSQRRRLSDSRSSSKERLVRLQRVLPYVEPSAYVSSSSSFPIAPLPPTSFPRAHVNIVAPPIVPPNVLQALYPLAMRFLNANYTQQPPPPPGC